MPLGAIDSTKIPTGPTGKSGPPQKVDLFFRNFSGWTEPIHWVLDRNFRTFWLNGSRPLWGILPENLDNAKSLLPVGVRSSKTAYRLCFAISMNVIGRKANKPESRDGKVKWFFYRGALASTMQVRNMCTEIGLSMQAKGDNHNQGINILSVGAPVRHPFIDELIGCTLMALKCTQCKKATCTFWLSLS